MNKRLSNIIRCFLFFIIGIFIYQLLTYIFVPKWLNPLDPATARIKGIYKETKNTIDVVFVGNSEGSRGYSPIYVWDNYGITSYNFGSSFQTTQVAYYKIQEMLKYQTPQIIIFEPNSLYENKTDEQSYRKFFDNLKNDEIKIKAVFDENIPLQNRFSYIFPLLRFHTRWNQLEENDFKFSLIEEYNSVSYKGMPMIADVKPYLGDNDYMMNNNYGKNNISEDNLIYMEKIVKLCEERDIKLILLEVPTPNAWSLDRSKEVERLSKKYNIDFIDCNLLQKEININWLNDTYDEGFHLNIYGAEKISKYIGKILSENYNCINHKQDKELSSEWNYSKKYYDEGKKKLKVRVNK